MRKFAEYLILQLVLSIVQVLPINACAQLCRWIAWLFADVIKFREKVIDENILGVFPDMASRNDARCLGRCGITCV